MAVLERLCPQRWRIGIDTFAQDLHSPLIEYFHGRIPNVLPWSMHHLLRMSSNLQNFPYRMVNVFLL